MSSRAVVLPTTFLMLAAAMGGCGDDEGDNRPEDGHFYCTNAQGQVIDEDYCDDSSPNYDSGMFFMYMGSSMHAPPAGYASYPVGHKLPPAAPKFKVTDAGARTKFGLPASGRISNGTVKTGVIGKGGAGSISSGGKSGGGGAKGGGSAGG